MATSILENVRKNFNSENNDENSELILEIPEKPEEKSTNTETIIEGTDVSYILSKDSLDLELDYPELVFEIPELPKEESISIEEATEFDLKKVLCPIQTPHNEGSVKDTVDTGFDLENSLVYKPCSSRVYSEPLYKENFLSEFETDDEKRQARHNLGLYDEEDVIAMSLLTTGDEVTDTDILDELNIKIMELGSTPFAVQTTAKAVLVKLDDGYSTLLDILGDYTTSISKANSRIDQLLLKSTEGTDIKTIGDINIFLTGYKNTETLVGILEDYLKFESKGTIEQKAWQI